MSKHSHYFVDVSGLDTVDVYRMIELIGITCPVAQHVFKKAWATGKRGHKDLRRDWQDIADSAARRLQMMDEDAAKVPTESLARAMQQAKDIREQCPDESRRVDAAWEAGEARMDIIGLNGNDGEHYPVVGCSKCHGTGVDLLWASKEINKECTACLGTSRLTR